jgi:hypothetical protein
MRDKGKTAGGRDMHAIILSMIGTILVIVGLSIATAHGTGLRGSGLGTAAIVAGVVLLTIAYLRFSRRRA